MFISNTSCAYKILKKIYYKDSSFNAQLNNTIPFKCKFKY